MAQKNETCFQPSSWNISNLFNEMSTLLSNFTVISAEEARKLIPNDEDNIRMILEKFEKRLRKRVLRGERVVNIAVKCSNANIVCARVVEILRDGGYDVKVNISGNFIQTINVRF
jgi:hypothetical protein